MEGTEVNGLMAEVLPFLSILGPRTTFYDTAAENLERRDRRPPVAAPTEDEVVFVLAEDFEDVNGMARQVGLAAQLVDASFIALSGDLTFAGLPVETYIVDTFDYYSENRPVYFAPGIHDTPAVVDAAEARGAGTSRTARPPTRRPQPAGRGRPADQQRGRLRRGRRPARPRSGHRPFVANTVDQVCAESRPDFVLLHDHLLGRRIAEAGCQEVAVLDGRSFQFVGPQQVPPDRSSGDSTTPPEFTGGSTGGHVDTKPDPGSVTTPARFAILTFRPDRGDARTPWSPWRPTPPSRSPRRSASTSRTRSSWTPAGPDSAPTPTSSCLDGPDRSCVRTPEGKGCRYRIAARQCRLHG